MNPTAPVRFDTQRCYTYAALLHAAALLLLHFIGNSHDRAARLEAAQPWFERNTQRVQLAKGQDALEETERILSILESLQNEATEQTEEADLDRPRENDTEPERAPIDSPDTPAKTPNARPEAQEAQPEVETLKQELTALKAQLPSLEQSLSARPGATASDTPPQGESEAGSAMQPQSTERFFQGAEALRKTALASLSKHAGELPAEAQMEALSGLGLSKNVLALSQAPELIRREARPRNDANPALLRELSGSNPRPARVLPNRSSDTRWLYVDTWHTVGPFPNPKRINRDTAFPPETYLDLDAIYEGANGDILSWQFHQSNGYRISPPTMNVYTVHYAYTEIRSEKDRNVWFALGSDDFLKLWVNDILVFESYIDYKEWGIAEAFIEVELNAGYNKVLARLENTHGPGEFSLLMRPRD